ncbi:MAG: hypothetical protein GX589_11185 [Deltaproteobacteria bacterium]|nr:hypothetical protein [Deltaproteobacteria bacterium]
MLQSITLLGSASGRNAGDAALLAAIMDSIDEACAEKLLYEIPSLNPNFIRENYSNRVRPIGVMPWHASLRLLGVPTLRSLLRTDMSLIFDATLFDRALFNPMFNFLSSYAVLLPIAKKRGKLMGCFTSTIGPVRTPRGRDMLRRVLELMDFITIRDVGDLRAMREAGVTNPNVVLTNDAALLTHACSVQRAQQIRQSLGLNANQEVLALNVNRYFNSWSGGQRNPMTHEEFVNTYVAGLEEGLKEVDAQLLFVSTQHMDETLTREIMEKVNLPQHKALLSNREYGHAEICGVLSGVSLLSAMRLHCLLLASVSAVPVIGINYLPKVRTYMETLEILEYSLDFDDFSAESVAEHLRRGWRDRPKLRALMQERIPRMQEQVRLAPAIVAALHRGESISPIIDKHRAKYPD